MRKKRQEQLKKEHKQRQLIYNIKGIFLNAFTIDDITRDKPIIEKLVHIVDKVNTVDNESNTKLIMWLAKKYHSKDLEKMSSAISLKQVELSTKVTCVKVLLESIYKLYTKLCDVDFFMQRLQEDIKAS